MSKSEAIVGMTLVLWACGSVTAVCLQDDFESYQTQAEFEAAWPRVYTDSSLALIQGFGRSGQQSVRSEVFSTGTHRNYRNLNSFTACQGTDANPLKFEFWIYVDSSSPSMREYTSLYAYSGDGYGQGSLTGMIAMGLYSDYYFDARTLYGGSGGSSGWIALSIPRTLGWHRMTALIKSAHIEYYVDGTLGGQDTFQSVAFDAVVLGSGLTSLGGQSTFYDGILVAVIPEPATILLLSLALVGRKRVSG